VTSFADRPIRRHMLAAEVPMSHSAPGHPPAGGRLAASAYSAAEWRLLIRLPGRVAVAATPVDPRRPVRGVLAGLAGLDGIAAGRAFDSDLVRAVVAAIYAEPDHGPPPAGTGGTGAEPAELFAACRAATDLLAERADPADSAAYRQWVQTIAVRAGRAAAESSGPPPAAEFRGGRGSAIRKQWFAEPPAARRGAEARERAAQLAFLADLGQALGLARGR
jgi:hypothetical protein